MKQKIVVQVSMKRGSKYRSKALKIAASVSGNVEKISLEGDDKDKIEVIGDLDPVELTELLRKGFGSVRLESVTAVKDEDDKDKDKDKAEKNEGGITCTCSCSGVPHQSSYCHGYFSSYPPCYSIYPPDSIW